MKELDHPKVLKLLAIVSKEEPLMIVTEYLSNGDLKAFFDTDKGQMLDEYALHNISFQVGGEKCYEENLLPKEFPLDL